MSSEVPRVRAAPVPVPHTAIPLGITDPVEKARAELKAALAAIEVKANVPRRVSRVIDDSVEKARTFSRSNPALAGAAVIAGAAAVGAIVWGLVRALHALSRASPVGACRPGRASTGHRARTAGYARGEAVQWCGCCRPREPDSNARRLLERQGRPTQPHESRTP